MVGHTKEFLCPNSKSRSSNLKFLFLKAEAPSRASDNGGRHKSELPGPNSKCRSSNLKFLLLTTAEVDGIM